MNHFNGYDMFFVVVAIIVRKISSNYISTLLRNRSCYEMLYIKFTFILGQPNITFH